MKKNKTYLYPLLLLLFALTATPHADGAWVWSPEAGKFVNPDELGQETPQKQYEYAMDFYKRKDLKEAADQFRILLKKFPSSQVASESQARLGNIYEELGDYYRAFRSYRDLLARYPQSERVAEAIERMYRIGNLFLSGRRAKVMGLSILPSGPRAIEVFKYLAEAAPYSEYGDKAQFQLGIAYKKGNQFEEAIQAFQGLIDQHPQSDFVPQARYQIADTSYLQSVAATRDQRVLDRAAKEIDKFLARYPDSSVSDKAAKLRQEIDEKNAEKNYRIALFYEKENFLDSAFIYYRDVAKRYPHTSWGKKAEERLHALEQPAEFLKSREAELSRKREKVAEDLQGTGEADMARKRELESELKRLEKEEKELRKSKPEALKRRQAALEMKEKSLREKWRALKKKQKFYAKNPSDDLAQAFQRWEASLGKEETDLQRERLRIKEWEKSLGVKVEPFYSDWAPFGKEEPTPVERVQEMEAKRLRELVDRQMDLVKEKEKYYRDYEKLLASQIPSTGSDLNYESLKEKLEKQAGEMQALEKQIHEKQALYETRFGKTGWPAGWGVPVIKPFEGTPRREWRSRSAEELQTLHERWREKISEQQKLVETISRSFDDELARMEERRLTEKIGEAAADASTLRRQIKQLEREIRSRYNEIQDRNEHKNELLEELEKTLRGKRREGGAVAQTGRTLTAPARGLYDFSRAFLLGLPDRDVKLTQEAKRLGLRAEEQSKIRSLREDIELESLLIDARNREIDGLKRELEAVRAKASLAKASPGRSLLVKFPYVFIREAIVSANRLVPKKERHQKLIEQLNKETERLEGLKRDLAELEKILREKEKEAGETPVSAGTRPQSAPMSKVQLIPDARTFREEIETFERRHEFLRANYELEKKSFDKVRWDKIVRGRGKVQTQKLKEIEEELIRLIRMEQEVHEEELGLLSKRKELVDQFLSGPSSEIFSDELRSEQERISDQLSEIQRRKTSLGEELRRLRPQALSPS